MEVLVMALVIVPSNFTSILKNPTVPPIIDHHLVEQIQAKMNDTPIILGEKCFLHLLAYERHHITIHGLDDIHAYSVSDAARLAAYLVHVCNLPEDTSKLDVMTCDPAARNEQQAKCFLETVAYHLHKLHYSTRITYHGQAIKFPRPMQQTSRVFGFFAKTFNRYGTPDISKPDDTADQPRSLPNSSKPH
jgi:hypothetical protein